MHKIRIFILLIPLLCFTPVSTGANITAISEPDLPPVFEAPQEAPENASFQITGTWVTQHIPCPATQTDRWAALYTTCFSPDGGVIHYGSRNYDKGTWEWIDELTVRASYTDCNYAAVGSPELIKGAGYQCTYTFRDGMLIRSRSLAAETAAAAAYEDMDNYSLPLSRSSNEYDMDISYSYYPESPEYSAALEQAVLEAAACLYRGEEVSLERTGLPYEIENVTAYDITGDGTRELFVLVKPRKIFPPFDKEGILYVVSRQTAGGYQIIAKNSGLLSGGYLDVLAPDGTELIPHQNYAGSSSWKGGRRIHLGFHGGQVTVEKEEIYSFHGGPTLIIHEDDYLAGYFRVYAADSSAGSECYTGYHLITGKYPVDEEQFTPLSLPFTGYVSGKVSRYPAAYTWNPFYEDWWYEGGRYPEDPDAYRPADWIENAAGDSPDQILDLAVAQSGLTMEKTPYPWTPETKATVTELLRCPVADYYYLSDYSAAAYMRGTVVFYEKSLSADGYIESWEEVTAAN